MAAIVMNSLTTVDEVIDALGGNTAVRNMMSVSAQAVSNWRKRRRIPPRHYSTMTKALSKIDRSAPPGLWSMTSPDSPSA